MLRKLNSLCNIRRPQNNFTIVSQPQNSGLHPQKTKEKSKWVQILVKMKNANSRNAKKIRFLIHRKGKTSQQFLTYISPKNAQYHPMRHNTTSLPEIDQNRK